MRGTVLAVLVLVAASMLVSASHAGAGQRADPLEIDAAAWYLVGQDGVVLAQRNSRRQRPIASITKLMTVLVALERARLSDVVRVPPAAVALGGSTVFLQAGDQLTVADLARATLVPSANDAALALALHVGKGSTKRFVELMNDEAQELGLVDTSFVNPHGLDEAGHVSSARDATALVRHALGVPFIRDALDRETFSYRGSDFPTTDDLLVSWPPLVGGKTGHTQGAGWSEAAAAAGGGATVYGTVLGVDSREGRNDALRSLLRYGLASYRRIAAVDATRVYAEAETGYGQPAVELVAERTLTRTVHRSAKLVERVVAPTATGLPVRDGQRLGRVEVYDGDRLLASSNLVAADAVEEPDVFAKTVWFARRIAGNMWELIS